MSIMLLSPQKISENYCSRIQDVRGTRLGYIRLADARFGFRLDKLSLSLLLRLVLRLADLRIQRFGFLFSRSSNPFLTSNMHSNELQSDACSMKDECFTQPINRSLPLTNATTVGGRYKCTFKRRSTPQANSFFVFFSPTPKVGRPSSKNPTLFIFSLRLAPAPRQKVEPYISDLLYSSYRRIGP